MLNYKIVLDRGCVISKVDFLMWHAQMKKEERGRRRKMRFPCGLILGHIVKKDMTVILQMGRYQII